VLIYPLLSSQWLKHILADIPELRPMLQNYLACGDKPADAADFFSLNVYEWCGSSSFGGSGYNQLVANATGLQIPIFISETGCRIPKPRLFADQASIFGTDMDGSWSGAIVYEWIEESNDYGLISYGPTVDASNPTALNGYVSLCVPFSCAGLFSCKRENVADHEIATPVPAPPPPSLPTTQT